MSLRPDQVGDPLSGLSQSANLWFNPAVYAVPAPFTFGTAARNALRGPGLFGADWSLSKNFALTERFHLQLRWEAFNVFNQANLTLPDPAIDSGTAGKIFDVATPMRNMQLGLR